MSIKIKFLGAAGCVTGSKYLVKANDKNILVDVGMFQGARKLRERNWRVPEIDLAEIDAVLLTHAHIDHTGLLPRYYNLGLNCPVYATKPTIDLCNILLPDAGYLQEEEADYRRRKKKSRHNPPLPLFTLKDAKESLGLFKQVPFSESVEILPGVSAEWTRAGHIIGAASINLKVGDKKITFSGDLGRYDIPILKDPEPLEFGDLLLIESTYGSREHVESNPKEVLADVVNRTYQRRGTVIIPSFAVGRAQLILYYLRELKDAGEIPDIPVIVDSPMACDATEIYRSNPSEFDDDALGILSSGKRPFKFSKLALVSDREASKKLNQIQEPMVIISASGMLYGGRILHHLKNRISYERNTVVFVGYQPPGSRGAWIKSGAENLRIFGDEVPIKAEITSIDGLSAHAGQDELLDWCRSCTGKPGKVAIVHGEPDESKVFKTRLEQEFGWDVDLAGYLEELEV